LTHPRSACFRTSLVIRWVVDRQQAHPRSGEQSQRIQVLPVLFCVLSRGAQDAPVQADGDGAAQVAGLRSADPLTPGHPIADGDGW